MKTEEVVKILSQQLDHVSPTRLREQLSEIDAIFAYVVTKKREAMDSGNPDKGIWSDYQRVLEKKISTGQSMLSSFREEMKRQIL